jgi:DNA-nicking Smr family endonuclease
MDTVLEVPTTGPLDIKSLKSHAIEQAKNIKTDEDFSTASTLLRQLARPQPAAQTATAPQPAAPAQPAPAGGAAK